MIVIESRSYSRESKRIHIHVSFVSISVENGAFHFPKGIFTLRYLRPYIGHSSALRVVKLIVASTSTGVILDVSFKNNQPYCTKM